MAFKSESAETIAHRIATGENLLLIDIREPQEWQVASIAGAEQRAMSTLQEWWQELPTDCEVVIFCHHGGRSMQVCQALSTQAGLTNLTNMDGGIDRWSLRVDPTIPRY